VKHISFIKIKVKVIFELHTPVKPIRRKHVGWVLHQSRNSSMLRFWDQRYQMYCLTFYFLHNSFLTKSPKELGNSVKKAGRHNFTERTRAELEYVHTCPWFVRIGPKRNCIGRETQSSHCALSLCRQMHPLLTPPTTKNLNGEDELTQGSQTWAQTPPHRCWRRSSRLHSTGVEEDPHGEDELTRESQTWAHLCQACGWR
jgi:hypothetical protein